MPDAALLVATAIRIKEIEAEWKIVQSAKGGWITSPGLGDAVQFFLDTIDKAIKDAQTKFSDGETKKKFVMDVISAAYDIVILKVLPNWAWLMNSLIKDVVINIIVSKFIDFMVSKYKELGWTKVAS